jgi:hypothetical protein
MWNDVESGLQFIVAYIFLEIASPDLVPHRDRNDALSLLYGRGSVIARAMPEAISNEKNATLNYSQIRHW